MAAVASPNPSFGDIVIWIHIYQHKLGHGIETEQRQSPQTNSVRAGTTADWDPLSPDGCRAHLRAGGACPVMSIRDS